MFDFYGHGVSMNFMGKSTYRTNIGAIFSIIFVICMLGYTVIKMIQMVMHQQPDFIVNTVLKDMYTEYPEVFPAKEAGFEFAVALISIRPW